MIRGRVIGGDDPADRPECHVRDCMWPFRDDDAVHHTGGKFRDTPFGSGASWNPVFWIDRIDPDWFVHVDFIGWTNAATWYFRGDRPRGLLRNGADLSTIPIHRH